MIRILHLSDIHLGSVDQAETYRSQLEADLKRELNIDKLDYLVVAGDIADKSTPEEYIAAETLFTGLMKRFEISPAGLVIVPGNHDLNWGLSQKAYQLMDKTDCTDKLEEGRYIPVTEEVVRMLVPERYKERFRHFSDFHLRLTGRPYPLEYAKQGLVHAFADKKLLFCGLNSSWDLDHHFRDRAGIHTSALNLAMDEMSDLGCDDWLKIAVFHHPVTGPEMMKKVDFLERLSVCGFQVLLHGHIHEAQHGFYHYDDKRQIHIVGSGTFGAATKEMVSGIPHQYNFLEFDPSKNRITVHTRKKVKPEGAWSADPLWGDRNNPVSYYPISLKSKTTETTQPAETCALKTDIEKGTLEIPNAYREWVLDLCSHMDVDRLQEKGTSIKISLPEVFIPLHTTSGAKKEEESAPDTESLLKITGHTRDVEDIIAQGHDLIIQGEAGSGKTTLIKHVAYMCLTQPDWKGLEGVLPVLIFLKDLKGFERMDAPQNEETAEALLRHAFRQSGCSLDLETVRQYCTAGKALFLLDGLDEIEIELRNLAANALKAFRRVCSGGRFVFSGRPHGIESDVVNRFGKEIITILPLTMKQVDIFIRKWFHQAEQSKTDRVTKTAEQMISEIRDNPGVERLIYNPLMLTAVCILYYDKRELPSQRAELYSKFVENMLHRGKRFPDPELVHIFLRSLAYSNHIRKKKGCDIQSALALLKDIYPKKKDISDIEYDVFIQQTFSRIEPDCGLLKFEAGQLMFRHLTFQEFLTAEYIKDRKTKYDEAIQDYWEDEWYKEVVELLIGLLSINSIQWANDILEGALNQPDKPPFQRLRLAARSILDIHADRRSNDLIDLATEKMREVIASVTPSMDRADAGEIFGRLGDRRDLEVFIKIPDGEYETSTGKVKLVGFEMAKYPVTNMWYEKFIKHGGYENESFWTPEGLKWRAQTKAKHPKSWHDRRWNCPNHPVVGVCWWEADAFCRWWSIHKNDGYRYFLPTEKQWEAMAAGFKQQKYPWGKDFDTDKCNSEESKIGRTSSVGIFQEGKTPEGIEEISGNVWEWTRTNYHSQAELTDSRFEMDAQELYEKIITLSGDEREKKLNDYVVLLNDTKRQIPALRGGSWLHDGVNARCAARNIDHPFNRNSIIGFRCSRTRV